MWICSRCGVTFDEPRYSHPPRPPYREEFYTDPPDPLCPQCGCSDPVPAAECPVCGKVFEKPGALCPECEKHYDALTQKAKKRADELYYDLISEYAGGNAPALEYMLSVT